MEGDIIRITKGTQAYALVIRGRPPVEGTHFVTERSDEFQVGIIERPAGHRVQPHQHPPRDQTIHRVMEFLYVQDGKIRVTVLDEDWGEVGQADVGAGECILLLRGGHSVEMLEPTRIVEVKQGPYPGDAAAKIFPTMP